MRLNAVETGTGERVALLLHGMMGSAESWWRLTPVLVARGFRVVALDLPGHGLSYGDAGCSVLSAAEAVVETVRSRAAGGPIWAVGHSYGGTVLAAAADALALEGAIYVDTTCSFRGGRDPVALAAQYEADRQRRRSPAWLRESRPFYSEQDAAVEARAAEQFDPATAASISAGPNVDLNPGSGAILVRAVPSGFVSEEDARRMSSLGVDVRGVPGAAHTVWYSHFDEFCRTLPELFGEV